MVRLRSSDETRCRRAAVALLAECGLGALPVRPEEICRQKGIVYSHDEALPEGIWGALLRQDGTFVILVSARCPTVEHRRFSAAHELGHYRLPGHLEALLASGRHESAPPYTSADPLEQEANAFASELLMPESLVTPILGEAEIGLASVRAIAGACETSFTSAAIRYAQLTPDPVAIVLSYEGVVEFSYVAPALREYPGVAGKNPKRGDDLVRGTAAHRLASSPEKIEEVTEASDAAGLALWFPECESGGELIEESVGLGRYGRVLTVLSAAELPDFEDDDF
jgi:hypothetical protein